VKLQADERFMADNRLESTLLIWPNEMNVHGTLFGGIVTRTAIEMAYALAQPHGVLLRPDGLEVPARLTLQP
jgi:acyl-CoA hydrolase